MAFENLLYESADGISMITLNRQPANTLSNTMMAELASVFNEIERNGAVRVVILTGAGERFFCGGADLKELRERDAGDLADQGETLFNRIETFTKPVLVAINGAALGGGLELAMCCHIRYAADTARLGHPAINFGMTPAWGGTQRLPRLIGRTRALEMLLTGHLITAAEAEHWGLLNHVVPLSELLPTVRKLAERLVAAAPLAVKEILACVDTGLEAGLQKGMNAERESYRWISQTEDAHLGIHAFLTKQKPEFKGR